MSSPADALVAKGLALCKAGQVAQGLQTLADAVRLQPDAKTYWHLAQTQMRAQQFDQARQTCQAALALCPGVTAFYQMLAGIADKLGDADGAADILRRAVAAAPGSAELASEYANLLIRQRRPAEAIPAIEQVIALSPSPGVYRSLHKMHKALDDTRGAERAIRAGLQRYPLDLELSRYCAAFDEAAVAPSLAAMKAALTTPSWDAAIRSPYLRWLTETQAKHNRRAAGRPLNGAADWADLVRWPDAGGMAAYVSSLDQELAAPTPRAEALSERAVAAVAQMDWAGAEHWFAQARRRPTNTVADVATFDPAFYQRLERLTDAEIGSSFPPVTDMIVRGDLPATMIYVACDPKYFELFVPRLLDSLQEHGSTAGVHVHILDGTPDVWAGIAATLRGYTSVSIGLTAEGGAREKLGAGARDYYHAARYVRFHQYLAGTLRPTWLMDADLVALADPAPLFRQLEDRDFAATSSVISLETWSKIRAGLVGMAPTPAGLRYARLVAAYIAHWFANGGLRWGIDQQALFGCYFYLSQDAAPRTTFLDERFMNDIEGMPCIIRPVMDTASRWKKSG